jgi:hypothetical protein
MYDPDLSPLTTEKPPHNGVQQDAGYKPSLLSRYFLDLIRPPQECILMKQNLHISKIEK